MAGEIKNLLLSDGVDVSAPSELGLIELEEGTFTPVLKEGANTMTVSSVTGCYRKLGKLVHADLRITNITKGGATGSLTIEGLPYATAAGCTTTQGVHDLERFTANLGATVALVAASTTIIQFFVRSEVGGAAAALTASALDAGNSSDIGISITYETD